MSLFHALSSYLSLEYRRSVVKASILEPRESKLFLERVQNKLTPLILGSKECRMKGRGSKGWKRVSKVKEEELRCKNKRRWIYIRADSDRAEKLLDWQDSASSSQLHSLARSSSSSSISSTAFFHHFFFLSKMFSLSLSLYSNDTTFRFPHLFPYFSSLSSFHPSRCRFALLCPVSDHLSTSLWRSVFLWNKIQLGRELKRANCGQLVASLVKPSTTFQPSSYC